MASDPVILVNLLRVAPERQHELIALLEQNVETVIKTVPGWRRTRLIASHDGAGVVIWSEWDSAAAVEAMRSDERMKSYFPKLLELARFEALQGEIVHDRRP
jgi:quinol monooxygenase YgiN